MPNQESIVIAIAGSPEAWREHLLKRVQLHYSIPSFFLHSNNIRRNAKGGNEQGESHGLGFGIADFTDVCFGGTYVAIHESPDSSNHQGERERGGQSEENGTDDDASQAGEEALSSSKSIRVPSPEEVSRNASEVVRCSQVSGVVSNFCFVQLWKGMDKTGTQVIHRYQGVGWLRTYVRIVPSDHEGQIGGDQLHTECI